MGGSEEAESLIDQDIDAFCGNFLASQNIEYERLTRRQIWDVQQKWREAFCLPLYQQTGKWSQKEFADWCIFTLDEYPLPLSKQGKAPYQFDRLVSHRVGRFYMVFEINRKREYEWALAGDGVIPVYDRLLEAFLLMDFGYDFYLSDLQFKWTLVLTHEQQTTQLGPYFCHRRPDAE